MKMICLSLSLLRKRLLTSIFVMLEISIVCFFISGIVNVYDSSRRQVKFFSDLPYTTFCFLPPLKDSKGPDEEIMADFLHFVESNEWVKGCSDVSYSFVYDAKDLALNINACLLDDLTIQSFPFPTSAGIWLSEYTGTHLPCVVGGSLSSKYKVGDIIDIATLSQESIDQIDYGLGFYHPDNRHFFQDYTAEVVGILEEPAFTFNLNTGIGGSYYDPKANRVSVLTENIDENEPFMFVPLSGLADIYRNTQNNILVYCDKGLSEKQRLELSASTFLSSVDIADAVQSEVNYQGEEISVFLPLVIFCGIVAAVSMVAMCVLATLSNMELYRIYRVVGGTPKQVMMINIGYASLLTGLTMVFFTFLRSILISIYWGSKYSYFKTIMFGFRKDNFVIICAIALPFLLVSFLIPFFFNRKQSTMEFYRSE